MQVRKHRTQLGKVIGLYAQPVLSRCLDRKLPKARDRAGNRVSGSLLLNLFERDPPNTVGAPGFSAAEGAGKIARAVIAELPSNISCF